MKSPRHEDHNGGGLSSLGPDVKEETRRLGRQYDEEYFVQYGRGPFSYQTSAPYRRGESLWREYFGQIADLIVSELAPRTVLDAGCAIGFLVEALRERGVEAWGVDISEYAIEQVPETIRPFCWAGSITDEFERDYDLIVCIEVLEHLPPHLAPIAVANFGDHTNRVLFSASPDGFRDPTHLNVQPTDYWVELFARHGFFRNLDVDASVIAPQAIPFVRDEQTAVSVARAYERFHWRMLTELRDLRAARQVGDEAVLRAERAEAEIAALRGRLEERDAVADRAEAEIAALRGRLEERDAVAERAEAEIAALRKQEAVAEQAEAEIAALRGRLEDKEAVAERAEAELMALRWRWRLDEDYKAKAERAEAEMAAFRGTRIFRYTARARRLYNRLSRMRRAIKPQVASDGLVGYWIDAPFEGQIVESDLLIPVHGWVICKQSSVARIEVFVNGIDCGRARLGIVRPDVAAIFDSAEALISGFETLIDLRTLPVQGQSVRIDLEVETLGGDTHSLPPVRVKLDHPTEEEKPDTYYAPGLRLPRRTAPPAEIRLLVFTHHLGLGGGQLYLFELLRLLSRIPDFAATVVAPADGPLRYATEALGIPVVINGSHPVASVDQYEAQQAEIRPWARGGGFNAVLGNTLGCFPSIDLAARLGLPAVWAIHESFDLPSFWRAAYGSLDAVHPLVKTYAEDALASAAAVVFEANATRDLLAHHGDADRFVTIPYGIDIEEIERYSVSVSRAEARRRLQLPADATILLCLGTVEPRKAQIALAEAFSALAPKNPDAILAFVGAGSDPSSMALYNFVHEAGLANRVRIMPVTPDINSWYRAADALVCASDLESLPRTVLESMAFSVPVIATRAFGLPELIDDGVTGYLCESRDIGELVGALSRFLSTTPEEREAVGAAAAALVRERHDSRGYADAYHRLLRGLTEDPNRSPSEILAGG
jgi:D-inositol-3-phosphate glycosyltransferase